jgi:hypothetical protein
MGFGHRFMSEKTSSSYLMKARVANRRLKVLRRSRHEIVSRQSTADVVQMISVICCKNRGRDERNRAEYFYPKWRAANRCALRIHADVPLGIGCERKSVLFVARGCNIRQPVR